ncbi:MAG: hypothetical protein ACI9G1_001282 [Pirellulaceae bacterium]|jgi:hypothetical protein
MLPDFFDAAAPSPAAQKLLKEAHLRIDEFLRRQKPVIHNFVASDFRTVDACLKWIDDERLASGKNFCEWGCGFGVVAMLAALHEFYACGIEVEPDLIAAATELAEDFDVDVEFAQGSLIPDGGLDVALELESLIQLEHIDTDSPSAYEELGIDVDEFDLIFAYPWPGEELYWETIFDDFACTGALLLTYHGIEDLRLHRHV